MFSSKALAGPGYIILNVIRAMNIVGLLSVSVASVVMLVKTFVVSKFFFFDAASHVITGIISLFLVLSECSLLKSYFARNWPLLSPNHGFGLLGTAMLILGVKILGNMNKEATSPDSIGLEFWRIVTGSGIIAFVLGWINILTTYIFRDRHRGITARMVRSHGATAADHSSDLEPLASHTGCMRQSPFPTAWNIRSPPKIFSAGRGFRASVLPTYLHSRTSEGASLPSQKSSRRESVGPKIPINISSPIGINPQFAHLVRHPSQR